MDKISQTKNRIKFFCISDIQFQHFTIKYVLVVCNDVRCKTFLFMNIGVIARLNNVVVFKTIHMAENKSMFRIKKLTPCSEEY